jgi:hypothetical protein
MLNIRPYFPGDYLKLLPFLQKFDPAIGNDTWNRLLGYEWENKFGYRGMLLENDDDIVGFLCYILSTKNISGIELTYCNISSWVVDPEFRSKSLKLLSGLFKIKDLVLVNLSPHENILSIFQALRFETLAEYEYRINPFKFSGAQAEQAVNCKEITGQTVNNGAIKKIMHEHRAYANVHFYEFSVTKNGQNQSCIMAFNQKKAVVEGLKNNLKELPYRLLNKTTQVELLYCSDARFLTEHFSGIIKQLHSVTRARSINISEHFLGKKDPAFSWATKVKKDRPWFLYTDTAINHSEIDILYTEKVLLNF